MTDSGAAFPFHDDGTHHFSHPTMSIRDWFAGQALAGLFAGWSAADNHHFSHLGDDGKRQMLAQHAYKMADAMIVARGDKCGSP